MIVQFSDETRTKISSVLCAFQDDWDNIGEVSAEDPRYKEFVKKMFLLVPPSIDQPPVEID